MSSYRLSLDVGANSIGWIALQLSGTGARPAPTGILDAGVRVFPDGRNPKDGTSNAVARRMARAMRRNRDRFVDRRARLLDALTDAQLLPAAEQDRQALTALDPYTLRARGIEEKLELHELGRAIFHLNQRRGFKSSRKTEGADKESGLIKDTLRLQDNRMETMGARTFGHYLFLLREQGNPVRSRLLRTRIMDDKGKEKLRDSYDLYPAREDILREFDVLWRVQATYHPGALSDEARRKIADIIFFQRPLKPQVVGKCTFERSEDRARKVLPSVQRLRIYQELNHLQVIGTASLRGEPLTLEQRDQLAAMLCRPNGKKSGKSEVTFNQMRKKLRLSDVVFSHESDKRKGLEADTTSALLAHKIRFGSAWYEFDEEKQDQIVSLLLHVDDEEELIELLMEDFTLDRATASTICCTPLAEGYGRLGITASRKILHELIKDTVPYSEAVARAGYKSHSQFATGAARERLPYYGEVLERHVVPHPERGGHPAAPLEQRYGKVTNPTVHIALNQLRRVVNDIIKLHGKPAEIHLEVLRELKNSIERKKEITDRQSENQAINDECARRLREEFHLRVNRENIQRLRLWAELGPGKQICVYTGENITSKNLFTAEVEIDHILPFSKTLDDSMANKILCKRQGNQKKGNFTPFEAWGKTNQWNAILDRCGVLPANKRWRFTEEAMERYNNEEKDFIARHLTDSQYIARLARAYLSVLFDEGKAHKVVCLPGRLTGLFRHHLGLGDILDELNPERAESDAPRGEKNRNDHRHHAIDALVVGLMDRAFLQKAASINARLEQDGVYDFLEGFSEPWPGFRAEAREALGRIIVSHKPDHNTLSALHNENPFGKPRQPDPRGNAIKRTLARDLTLDDILRIKGRRIRAEIVAALAGMPHKRAFETLEELDAAKRDGKKALKELLGNDEKAINARLQEFLDRKGIRRVRLISQENTLRGIKDERTGKPYKFYKPDGNAYFEILEDSSTGQWQGGPVTYFDANLKGDGKHPVAGGSPTSKRVARLFNRDMLELEHQGKRKIFFIQRMSEKQIALAEHYEANADSRDRANRKNRSDADDPFKFVYKGSAEALRKSKVRFLTVTPAGKVRYLSDPPDDPPRR